MRIEELTYIVAEVKKVKFIEIRLIRSNISIVKKDQYVILYLN